MNPPIFTNVPLHDKNWFQTGGSALFFTEPTNSAQFSHALEYANNNNLDVFLLGQGANILISDDGFDGLIIRPKMETITTCTNKDTNFRSFTLRQAQGERREKLSESVRPELVEGFERDRRQLCLLCQTHHHRPEESNTIVTAGAGVTMAALIEYCLSHNLTGLEEFSGIPGTVGGSVYINLHYFEFLLAQFMVSAEIIDATTGEISIVEPGWFEFGYDHSKLHEKKHYLVNASFRVTPATDQETAFARGRAHEIIRHRYARYPKTHTCGSFFRNFHDHEVNITIPGSHKKMIYAAYYLDKVGVKGALSVGDAIVSHQHANMLVNKGTAKSSDIIELARTMQKLVYNQFGVMLQPECQLVGFREYPLYRDTL